MDRVRFGRALGRGARLAARTMYEAVDAATATAPAGSTASVDRTQPVRQPTRATQRAPRAPVTISAASRQARQAAGILSPVKRASRAVSLEITGSFFALFAFSFAAGAWHARAAVAAGGPALMRLLIYCAIGLLFGYFSCSNFIKAKRLK